MRLTGRGTLYGSTLLARSELCAHTRVLSGRCPSTRGAAALSERSAAALGVRVGSTLSTAIPGSSVPVRLRVVGIYALPPITATGYWEDGTLFDFGAGPAGGPPQLDAILVTPPAVWATNPLGDVPSLSMSIRARGRALRDGQVPALRRALAAFRSKAAGKGLGTSTGLFGLSNGVQAADATASTVVDVAAVQLVVLGLLVLYLVERTAARDRRGEAELAARRGFARRQVAAVAIGESALLLGAALPIGLLAAWGAVAALRSTLFVAGTPVGFPWDALAAGVAVVAAGLVAVGVATWDLWRGAARAPERTSRNRAVRMAADAAAVVLAVAGLVALSATGSLAGAGSSPVALVAPGLLAVGAGVLGLRIAEAGVRLAVRATKRSPRLGVFLAVRAVVRADPAPLRRALALTAAVVLATFGVNAWVVARANRNRVASVDVGAARVLDVTTPPGGDLAQLVTHADPAGRTAMAAEELVSGTGDTLAVQAGRLAAVAAWPPGLADRSVAAVARALAPPAVAPLTFRAGALTAEVTLPAGAPPVQLNATVFNEVGQNEETASFPTFGPGTHSLTGSLTGFCQTTCRLVGLSPTVVNPNARVPSTVDFRLDGLALAGSGTALPIHPRHPGDWTARPSGIAVLPGTSAVTFRIPGDLLSSQGTLLAPADLPATIPAVATTQALSSGAVTPGSSTFDTGGLDGGTITVTARATASRLPEIGADAVLIDLRFAQLAQSGPSDAVQQVWLRGPGSAAVLRRLTTSGVRVVGEQTAAGHLRQLDHTAVATAYSLVLGAGTVAVVLAVGATSFVLLAGARRRRSGLHSLMVGGAALSSLRSAVTLENTIALAVPLLVGGAAGYGASALALGSLPQLVGGSGGVPLSRQVAAGPLVGVLVALALVFAALTAMATATTLGRKGRAIMRAPR